MDSDRIQKLAGLPNDFKLINKAQPRGELEFYEPLPSDYKTDYPWAGLFVGIHLVISAVGIYVFVNKYGFKFNDNELADIEAKIKHMQVLGRKV